MNRQYYHISTKGTAADLFLDEEDFRQIVFIIALVFCRNSGVEVVAYCIMNNHIHIIVYGVADTIEKRFLELKKMYSMWYANKYGKSKILARNPYKIRKCEDIEDLKNCIGYVYANPVKGGLCTNAFYYPWSSIAAHFRDEWSEPNPSAESALRTSKSLLYFVTRKDSQITNSRETEFLCNDASARTKAAEIVLQLCGRAIPLNSLPSDLSARVANILRYNYGTPLPIIKRILG